MSKAPSGYSIHEYLAIPLNPKGLKQSTELSAALLKPRLAEFDALLISGYSGALYAGALSVLINKPICVVYKQGEAGHGSMVKGAPHAERYLFVDDFIDSGATIQRTIERLIAFRAEQYKEYETFDHDKGEYTVHKTLPTPRIIGFLCYNDGPQFYTWDYLRNRKDRLATLERWLEQRYASERSQDFEQRARAKKQSVDVPNRVSEDVYAIDGAGNRVRCVPSEMDSKDLAGSLGYVAGQSVSIPVPR